MAWKCNKCQQKTQARSKPFRCTNCNSYTATFTQISDTTVLTSIYDSGVTASDSSSGSYGSTSGDTGSSGGDCGG